MVSYFLALYFVLWMAVLPVGKSHKRRRGGQLREEAPRGDKGRYGFRSQKEDDRGGQTSPLVAQMKMS